MCFLPVIANLAPAIELLPNVPTELLTAATGALVGVGFFSVIVAILSRRKPRPRVHGVATDVVFIPPRQGPPAPHYSGQVRQGFVPSSALSARASAEMGYPFHEASVLAAQREIVELASSELREVDTGIAAVPSVPCASESFPSVVMETGPMTPVTVAAVVPIESVSTSSTTLTAAPIADLDLDDGPTELCEPLFDEPHHSRRQGGRSKIRPLPPPPPRSGGLPPPPPPSPPQRRTSQR